MQLETKMITWVTRIFAAILPTCQRPPRWLVLARPATVLLQEIAGHVHPSLGINGGWPSAIVSTGIMVLGWVYFLGSGPFATIWAMFGIANQMLAVIALAIAAVYLVNSGKGRYAWVAVVPMALVFTTTSSAAVIMLSGQIDGIRTQLGNTGFALSNVTLFNALLQATLIVMMLGCALIVLAGATIKVWGATEPVENLQTSAA